MKKITVIIIILLLLGGCTGRNFVRPAADEYSLGSTTYAQVLQKMGTPKSSSDVEKNGKPLKRIIYNYGEAGGEALKDGVTPIRQTVFIFYNDKLVSQAFISSFKSDNTDFDETKQSSVVKGKTNKADVLELLGRPSSAQIYPMIKDPSFTAIGYAYMHAHRNNVYARMKFYSKILTITFDDKDTVCDIDYELIDGK